MGDKVQAILETLTADMKEMETYGIMTRGQIMRIMAERREAEYVLNSSKATAIDFLKAITYEKGLESQRAVFKKKTKFHKKLKCDFSIVKRIIHLYHRMVKKFKVDVELWKFYVSYLMKIKATSLLKKILAELIRILPKNSQSWNMSATAYSDCIGDVNTARSLMQMGLRMNKEDKEMWAMYFKFEMNFLLKLKQREDVLLEEDMKIIDKPLNEEPKKALAVPEIPLYRYN
jgi:U3 small nucleolar RNA-associated protein 6